MPLQLVDSTAVLEGVVAVEDAEPLAAWLRTAQDPRVDLSSTTHLHTAALQCLLAAGVKVAARPADDFLGRWVTPLLAVAPAAIGDPQPTTTAPDAAEAPRTTEDPS